MWRAQFSFVCRFDFHERESQRRVIPGAGETVRGCDEGRDGAAGKAAAPWIRCCERLKCLRLRADSPSMHRRVSLFDRIRLRHRAHDGEHDHIHSKGKKADVDVLQRIRQERH